MIQVAFTSVRLTDARSLNTSRIATSIALTLPLFEGYLRFALRTAVRKIVIMAVRQNCLPPSTKRRRTAELRSEISVLEYDIWIANPRAMENFAFEGPSQRLQGPDEFKSALGKRKRPRC